jgi:hypothetical protein
MKIRTRKAMGRYLLFGLFLPAMTQGMADAHVIEDAGDDGLADPTLFATDEMDFRHESCSATEEGAMKRWLSRWDG